MKSFKTHLSLILPLLFLMFAFEFLFIINQTLKHYETLVNERYSIIIASTTPQEQSKLKAQIPSINAVQSIDTKEFIGRLKNNLSASNLATLEKNLPKFYKISLNHFPTQSELNDIKTKLLKLSGISKVEVFLKTYDQIYTLLSLMKFVFWFFLLIIIMLSVVLFFKQMRIWLFEHTERVEIMCLFGAPFWFRAFMLYKIVLVDCFIAFVILLVFFTQIFSLSFVQKSLEFTGISLPDMNFILHLIVSFVITLILSLLCVNSVMFKVKRWNFGCVFCSFLVSPLQIRW